MKLPTGQGGGRRQGKMGKYSENSAKKIEELKMEIE